MWSPRWSPNGRYLAALPALPGSADLSLFDIQTQRWAALPYKGISVNYPEWSSDSQFIYFLALAGDDRDVIRVRARDGAAERVVDLSNVQVAGGTFGCWMGLDPTDAPLLLRDISGEDIYALTLEEK